MSAEIWFSVVTACRNDLQNLRATGASLAEQTCREFEWVVVDAASGDGTPSYLADLSDMNVVWVSEPDGGIYDAYNKGARLARGRYLVYLGAGDCLSELTTLASVREFIERHPGGDMYFGSATEAAPGEQPRLRQARTSRTIWWNLFTHHQSIFYARRCFDATQYDSSYRIGGDYAFTAALLHAGARAVRMPLTTAHFMLGGASDQNFWLGERENWRARRELGSTVLTRAAIWAAHAAIRIGRKRLPRLYSALRYVRAKPPTTYATQEFSVDGVRVQAAPFDDAVNQIAQEIKPGPSFCVCTINLDHVFKRRANHDFRRAYDRARFVVPDGFPIALAGRLALNRRVDRVCGSDLIEPLCRRAAHQGLAVYLYGSQFETLRRCARKLAHRIPGLKIAGVAAPCEDFDPTSEDADHELKIIAESGAQMVFVALGAPKQELFSQRAAERMRGCCFLSIGAGLDFIAGQQSRAPSIARKSGTEWLWRLAHDPRRLAGRYARSLAVLPRVLLTARSENRLGIARREAR